MSPHQPRATPTERFLPAPDPFQTVKPPPSPSDQAFSIASPRYVSKRHNETKTPGAKAPVAIDGQHVKLADIKSQYHAKRALEIAASGGHNLFTY